MIFNRSNPQRGGIGRPLRAYFSAVTGDGSGIIQEPLPVALQQSFKNFHELIIDGEKGKCYNELNIMNDGAV
ncbi:MAG: hypothetical protein LUF84_00660 [Clostridiales bacterium]|nr:hypothetical protein [Clostridiales bacterium]